MGQNLSQPVTEKSSADGGNENFIYGAASMQGWRSSMEDAHTIVLDLQVTTENGEENKVIDLDSRLSLFGVYDGHGGDKVAQFAGENIHRIITCQESFKKGDNEQALKDGFLATDRAILKDPQFQGELSGCTATVGILSNKKIYMANAGDSRAVLGIKGRAKPLSFDHKPMNEGEKIRIISAGGTVEFGRVNGNLALSRAIGDFEFKKNSQLAPEQQVVTAYPDVIIHNISNDDEFMVIACDGIWDCQSSQSVVEFIRRGIAAKQELSTICENLMDNCLSSSSEVGGIGCDNMTVVIVGLLHGKSKTEWYENIAGRVSEGDGPCAPPEYAELRGPLIRKNFDDSDNGFQLDPSKGLAKHLRRIILLGDGSDSLTNPDNKLMSDLSDEDHDLRSQVSKVHASSHDGFGMGHIDCENSPKSNANTTTDNLASVSE
ncbi:Protein phosphatase 2C-like protein 2 [Golovinomyces cichoracearum]|uniref:Protein phosphatase 2C homolog 2 n=1 Tax=Golovinomyces cichoracearum TaxID=62708 RepID=A0A420IJV6_9PEZI|nr:Protein phosphatase 2C-like protein 2 [Golovinomyces cichoracearum]